MVAWSLLAVTRLIADQMTGWYVPSTALGHLFDGAASVVLMLSVVFGPLAVAMISTAVALRRPTAAAVVAARGGSRAVQWQVRGMVGMWSAILVGALSDLAAPRDGQWALFVIPLALAGVVAWLVGAALLSMAWWSV